MTGGWIRERGRADYRGWMLHIQGDRAHVRVGHPLHVCLFWLAAWRLRLLKDAPICGRIAAVSLERRP